MSTLRALACATAVALAFGATGCCRCVADLDGFEGGGVTLDPPHDLGTGSYPPSEPASRASVATWAAPRLKPNAYRVGYALSSTEAQAVDRSLADYARRVQYQSEGSGQFRWVPPAGCAGGLGCIYQALAERDRPDLLPLVERFRARAREATLSTVDLATLVVTYVQSITYEIPDEPFGVLPPALVAARQKGDCDSKALLGHMLLRELGIDTMMIASDAHRHEMLGIALPVSGTTFTYGGRQYAFTEMTAKGSPIGHINPHLLRPDDWTPVAFRYPSGTAGSTAGPPVQVRPVRVKKRR